MLRVTLSDCRPKDLESLYILSQMLAHYFPRPEECVTPIYELLLNAIEHGNLGIGFDEKTDLIRGGKWHEEIGRRLALPENGGKAVEIVLEHDARECRLTIRDQGGGFPWREFSRRPVDQRRPNGRGLAIAFGGEFDRIVFNAAGNEVTCVMEYAHNQKSAPRAANAG